MSRLSNSGVGIDNDSSPTDNDSLLMRNYLIIRFSSTSISSTSNPLLIHSWISWYRKSERARERENHALLVSRLNNSGVGIDNDRQRFTTDEKHILSSASHPHPYHPHLIRFLFTHEYHDTRKSERARERENKRARRKPYDPTPRTGRYSDTELAVEAFPRLAALIMWLPYCDEK